MTDIATKLLRQEYQRLRSRAAFFHGCAADKALLPESREASAQVADALGLVIGNLADMLEQQHAQQQQLQG